MITLNPNASISADMGDPLKYELSFINLFEFEDYQAKVNDANAQLQKQNLAFQLKIIS